MLVDEFQDLTPAHVLLIRLLAMPGVRRLRGRRRRPDDLRPRRRRPALPRRLRRRSSRGPRRPRSRSTTAAPRRSSTAPRSCSPTTASGCRRRSAPAAGADPDAAALEVRTASVRRRPRPPLVELVRGLACRARVGPGDVAVLTRVNSLLLAPQVALWAGGRAGRLGRPRRRARAGPGWRRRSPGCGSRSIPTDLLPADLESIRAPAEPRLPALDQQVARQLPLARRPARSSAGGSTTSGSPARSTSWPTTSGCSPGSPAAGAEHPRAARGGPRPDRPRRRDGDARRLEGQRGDARATSTTSRD